MSASGCRMCLCAVLWVSTSLWAAASDPPGRVGRISLASDGVWLRIGDSNANGESALNWPLTTGALIETADGTRSEARIGSSAIRLDGGTSLEFLELSDESIRLRLHHGRIAIAVRNPRHAAELRLDTPQGRLRIHEAPGSYRVDVAGGTTAFSAYLGSAYVEEIGLAVSAGERILLLGGTGRNYLLGQAHDDPFRQWSLAREQTDAGPENRHVSPEMTGQEMLDRHGIWRETAEYGMAWFPQSLPAAWAPYRVGRWKWVSPWGWTWIDHAPWGFAPFHYGRWGLVGGRWGWMPGTYIARPVYAPALVVWLGQPGWNVSVSIGAAPAVGWYPLGPREVFYPNYRCSTGHVRNINLTHITHVTRIISSATPPVGYGRHHVHRHRHGTGPYELRQTALHGPPAGRATPHRDRLATAWAPPPYPPPPIRLPQGSRRIVDAGRSASLHGNPPKSTRDVQLTGNLAHSPSPAVADRGMHLPARSADPTRRHGVRLRQGVTLSGHARDRR